MNVEIQMLKRKIQDLEKEVAAQKLAARQAREEMQTLRDEVHAARLRTAQVQGELQQLQGKQL